ncbi:MAG TPA: glutamine synthetase family protein [Spirochaetia bacterium]|nr:glutamine synthetase family protein [Spirochaetia bacterium]
MPLSVPAKDWHTHIHEIIRQHQIHTVRVCIQDNSNIALSRYVPTRHFLEHITQTGLSFPSAIFSLDTSATLQPAAGDGFAGGFPSWFVKPDIETFSILPYNSGICRVIADLYDQEGKIIESSPRQVLRRVLEEYARSGYRIKGAFEYEFYVFHKSAEGDLKPVWEGLHCFSEVKQAEVEDIIHTVVKALSDISAGPEVANTEYGSGQFEVSHSPFWGIQIADMAFYYRASIKESLARQGYLATFMSKPLETMSGSGAHLHHSLFDAEGNNLFFDPNQEDGLSDLCRWFIGGQLKHAKALCCLVNSTINSYKRIQPYSFAPTEVSWGYEHRSAMIRIPHARGDQTRLENRLPGADTNPYIALAATLAAGLDGIRNRTEPPRPLRGDDGYSGTHPSLPRSLWESLQTVKEDPWVSDSFHERFLHQFLTLRQSELNRYLRHVSSWEINEYLDVI